MKIKVHKPLPVDVTDDELSALLQAAGCSEAEEREENAEADGESTEPKPRSEDEVPADGGSQSPVEASHCLIVVIGSETAADETLSNAVGSWVARGGRVVGIWVRGTTAGDLPTSLDTFGSGICIWEPDQVRDVVSGRDDVWSQPDGSPRPMPITERNLCR